jgi:hypothetical protein
MISAVVEMNLRNDLLIQMTGNFLVSQETLPLIIEREASRLRRQQE